MKNVGMRKIPIKNKELLGILNKYLELRTTDQDAFQKYMHLSCRDHQRNNPEKWVSTEYLHEIINEGENHEGFPDSSYSYEFRTSSLQHRFFEHESPRTEEEAQWRTFFIENLRKNNIEITNFLGIRNQALSAIYPPKGYIAWHNNANAAAWNFIFTYSETGDGYFKYWDIEKKEVVYMHDEPGWTLKAGYFGRYDEPENVFYHSAATNCWRHTLSFCFDTSETAELFREELIDEIMSE